MCAYARDMGLLLFLSYCEAVQTVLNERPVYVHTKYICAHIISWGLPALMCYQAPTTPPEVSGGNR